VEEELNRERVRRSGATAAIASFALLALVACGGESVSEVEHEVTRIPTMSDAAAQATRDAASGATPEATAAGGATPAAGGTAAPAATTAEVVSQDIFFEPTEITIPANTDVTISLPNEGAAAHNFSIDELDISVDLPPGETKEVVINAPAGTYEFYCNVPGHREAGMVGTLTVSEEAAPAAGATTPAAAATPVAGTPGAAEATPVEEAAATTEAEAATPAATAEEPAAAEQAAAEAVEVVSHDIFFEPKEITIPADSDVTVSLPNEGVTLHNFSIDALNISVDIQPGATEETVINAPAGTYEFYCNVPGHKAAGMVGTLTVG
jgi:uncharacterized cupredoxin-like copper-binding protein